MSKKIEFRPSDLCIKEMHDGTEFIAIKNGFDRVLIDEMREYGVTKWRKAGQEDTDIDD